MIVSLIVAFDSKRTIGFRNQLPWHLPADLKHFKSITMGHSIVMGRKTYESIGKPLPGRNSVVVTNNLGYWQEGITVVHSLDQAMHELKDEEEVFNPDAKVKKTKGLAKAKEELALLTREMKSLAKKYSKAEGEEKEKLVKILKDKTKLKKELESILDNKKI